MQAQLGWTFLSQNALARAEAQLNPDTQGVRDELGFLSLHRAYADRFFPGTSVQQTRLRYILFIPWIFRRVAEQNPSAQVRSAVEKEEVLLAGRLKRSGEEGVIGSRTYPRPPSQPPSVVYWNALGTWDILLGYVGGSYPSRFQVYRSIRHRAGYRRLHDDDGQPLEEPVRVFSTLPQPPDEWNRLDVPLTFQLTETEAEFVRGKFIGVVNPFTGKASLLARLAQERVAVSSISAPWDPEIASLVDDEEQSALQRACQAASATAIGRAVYAAMVEKLREREDGLPTARNHRDYLFKVINTHRDDCLALSVSRLFRDQPSLPHDLIRLIEETQSWLARGQIDDVVQLRPIYSAVEYRRKGRRARLPSTVAAQERRAEWLPKEHPQASPLDYRWGVVRRLLSDLQVVWNG